MTGSWPISAPKVLRIDPRIAGKNKPIDVLARHDQEEPTKIRPGAGCAAKNPRPLRRKAAEPLQSRGNPQARRLRPRGSPPGRRQPTRAVPRGALGALKKESLRLARRAASRHRPRPGPSPRPWVSHSATTPGPGGVFERPRNGAGQA